MNILIRKPLMLSLMLSMVCMLGILLGGCASITGMLNSNNQMKLELEESREVWNAERDAHGGSYRYTVGFESWTGYRSNTTIVVRNNEVVERYFDSFDPNSDNLLETEVVELEPGETIPGEVEPGGTENADTENNDNTDDQGWAETEPAELGTHPEGADAKTIDELYDECADSVLTESPAQNEFFLEFAHGGLLSRCTYVPNNCADDCAFGVSIDSITFLDGE